VPTRLRVRGPLVIVFAPRLRVERRRTGASAASDSGLVTKAKCRTRWKILPNAGRKGDFALGRLRYHSSYDRGELPLALGDRREQGRPPLHWAIEPGSLVLTPEPIETIIDIDSDEVFNLPFLLAISIGDWKISPEQGARLRQYFERGGFLLVDDFHNEREWGKLHGRHASIDPAAEAEELAAEDPAFHVIFDLSERRPCSWRQRGFTGPVLSGGGTVPHWRADPGLQGPHDGGDFVHQDIGDGWEFADDPYYPERFSSEAIRIGTSYAVYAMTH